jgi:hypothetical protein
VSNLYLGRYAEVEAKIFLRVCREISEFRLPHPVSRGFCFNLFEFFLLFEYFHNAYPRVSSKRLNSPLQHWLCYLGNTRVMTAQFWRLSIISSSHSVGLYSPISFSSFVFHIFFCPLFIHLSI